MTIWISGSLTTSCQSVVIRFAGDGIRARFVERLDRDFAEIDFDAEARGQETAVFLPRVEDAAADGAAANHAEIHLLHKNAQFAAKRGRGQFNFERERHPFTPAGELAREFPPRRRRL